MESVIFDIVLLLSCLVAWRRGGTPERAAAALLFSAAALSWLVLGDGKHRFSHAEWGLFGIDFVLAISLVTLALRADRYWPMWLSALQIVSVLMHPAFGLSQNKMAFAYAIASIFWSYPMMLILMVGSMRHYVRVKIAPSKA
jgi:hypothetical protein